MLFHKVRSCQRQIKTKKVQIVAAEANISRLLVPSVDRAPKTWASHNAAQSSFDCVCLRNVPQFINEGFPLNKFIIKVLYRYIHTYIYRFLCVKLVDCPFKMMVYQHKYQCISI